MNSQHIPVLLQETVDGLELSAHDTCIDGTVGGGGHTRALLQRTAPDGIVIGFDRDATALEIAVASLDAQAAPVAPDAATRFIPIHDSYAMLNRHLDLITSHSPIRGILLDLGLSSMQLDSVERGFSFRTDAPLDMRFDMSVGRTAADLLNSQSEEELRMIFRAYGEEPRAGALAHAIAVERARAPFRDTTDLLRVIERVIGRGKRKSHPASRIFQALRIAVNDELAQLQTFLPQALSLLAIGGRLAIISFHSLEDRIVKQAFKDACTDCICPPEFPECRCDHRAIARPITRKAIMPSEEEVAQNPRSRSSRLRIIEKIEPKKIKTPHTY